VRSDVRNRYVSAAMARERYGVEASLEAVAR
jgi:hypothetical protein